jgi:hypothetical protein
VPCKGGKHSGSVDVGVYDAFRAIVVTPRWTIDFSYSARVCGVTDKEKINIKNTPAATASDYPEPKLK